MPDPESERGLLSRLYALVRTFRDWLLVHLKRQVRGSSQDTETEPREETSATGQALRRETDETMARLLAGASGLTGKPAGHAQDCLLSAGRQPYSRDRQYRVYVPAGLSPGQQLPLVVVLHGCHQTHLDIQEVSGFDRIADREKFIVVYPYVTGFTGLRNINCWGWWLKEHRKRGTGEVEDIWRVVDQVSRDQPIDSSRVHICGLSAGAGMSVAALVTYSDRYASGASVAGLAFGESAWAVRITRYLPVRHISVKKLVSKMRQHLATPTPPPLLIIQSTTDKTVDAVCGQHLLQCWVTTSHAELDTLHAAQGSIQGVPWKLDRFVDSNQRLKILQLIVEGVEHGWLGGNPGKYSTPQGPVIAELVWWFFDQPSQLANKAMPDVQSSSTVSADSA